MAIASGIDIQATTAHIGRRIRATPVTREPWAHLVVDDFLPPSTFETLLRCLHEEYLRMGGGEPRSWLRAASNGALWHSRPENARFWVGREQEALTLADLFKAIAAPEVYGAISARLKAEIDEGVALFRSRYANPIELKLVTRLTRDGSSYDLRPHTDAANKLASIVLYVRADDGAQLGTALYVPLDPEFRCAGNDYHDFERFRLDRIVPFRPNSAFIFARGDRTFHGVRFEPVRAEGFSRITLQSNYWLLEPLPTNSLVPR